MLKTIAIVFFFLAAMLVLTSAITNGNQSPYGKTGSPGDGSDCSFCHSGTTVTDTFISVNIPAAGYISGKTYTVTVSAKKQGINKFGFELTAENISNNKVGNFVITNAAETKMVVDEVSHTGLGITGSNGQKTWNVDWIAPPKGTGQVTFYSAVNAANDDGGTGGDLIILSSLSVQENPANSIANAGKQKRVKLFPTKANDKITIESGEIIRSVTVFNVAGKKVINYNSVNRVSLKIDITSLNRGVYFTKITLTGKSVLLKFIKF